MTTIRLCTLVSMLIVWFWPSAVTAERLVYSVHSNTVVAGLRHGAPLLKASTTVHAWDPQTKTTATVFSDRDIDIVLLVSYGSGQYQERVIIPTASSLFALAAERKPGQSEVALNQAGAIYELTVDGSNRARRVASVQSELPLDLLAVSADGSKFAYVGYEDTQGAAARPSLVVVDSAGRTVAKTDLRRFLKDCRVSWLGWSADGNTLRWVLEAHTEGCLDHAGNYVTRWDGTAPTLVRSAFDEEVGLPVAGYPPDSTLHDWVTNSPSGKLLAWRRGVSPHPGDMETGEVWVREKLTHAESKIASVPPLGSIQKGLGAENHFVSLLGWLRE